METLNQNRTRNLKGLVDNAGSIAKLARKYNELDATYISQLLNGHRNFGEKAARKMEGIMGLPEGWFDIDHEQPTVTIGGSWPFESISISDYNSLTLEDKEEIEAMIGYKISKKRR